MVRFQATTATSDAEIRAARGAHPVVFEDGDHGLAFKARTPWMPWAEVDGCPALPYADFADTVLRVMGIPGAGQPKLFHRFQPAVEPLDRCWQQLKPLLGLASTAAPAALSRRALRALVREAARQLDAAGADALIIQDHEWIERGVDDTTRAPFTTHGGWIQHLTWEMLVQDGVLGPAADLVFVCKDSASDTAFSDGTETSYTRFALSTLAQDTRRTLEENLEGVALADEVARAIAAAAMPPELVHDTPTALRLARLRTAMRWQASDGDARRAIEARMLRIDLPGAISTLPGVRALAAGLPSSEIESTLIEFAAEADLPDRSSLSVALLRRIVAARRHSAGARSPTHLPTRGVSTHGGGWPERRLPRQPAPGWSVVIRRGSPYTLLTAEQRRRTR
jgi:hypothetical protein